MTVAILIQDNFGNSDNIVLVNTKKKQLIWVPRDLYSFYIHNRINIAFLRGGSKLFIRAIRKLGFRSVSEVICIKSESCHRCFEDLKITVPVEEYCEYYYPLTPLSEIENGKKIISFKPPYEELFGERIHQYLGARYRTSINAYTDLPDLERIKRQQIFVKKLLEIKYDFSIFLKEDIYYSSEEALRELYHVDINYNFLIFRNFIPVRINQMDVLVKRRIFEKIATKIKHVKLIRVIHRSYIGKSLHHQRKI